MAGSKRKNIDLASIGYIPTPTGIREVGPGGEFRGSYGYRTPQAQRLLAAMGVPEQVRLDIADPRGYWERRSDALNAELAAMTAKDLARGEVEDIQRSVVSGQPYGSMARQWRGKDWGQMSLDEKERQMNAIREVAAARGLIKPKDVQPAKMSISDQLSLLKGTYTVGENEWGQPVLVNPMGQQKAMPGISYTDPRDARQKYVIDYLENSDSPYYKKKHSQKEIQRTYANMLSEGLVPIFDTKGRITDLEYINPRDPRHRALLYYYGGKYSNIPYKSIWSQKPKGEQGMRDIRIGTKSRETKTFTDVSGKTKVRNKIYSGAASDRAFAQAVSELAKRRGLDPLHPERWTRADKRAIRQLQQIYLTDSGRPEA